MQLRMVAREKCRACGWKGTRFAWPKRAAVGMFLLYIMIIMPIYSSNLAFAQTNASHNAEIFTLNDDTDNSSISFIKNNKGYFTYTRDNSSINTFYTIDTITDKVIDSMVLNAGFTSKNLFKFYIKEEYMYLTILYKNEIIYNDKMYEIRDGDTLPCFDYLIIDKITKSNVKLKGDIAFVDLNTKTLMINGKSIPVILIKHFYRSEENKMHNQYQKIYYRSIDLMPIQIEYSRNSFDDKPYSIYRLE